MKEYTNFLYRALSDPIINKKRSFPLKKIKPMYPIKILAMIALSLLPAILSAQQSHQNGNKSEMQVAPITYQIKFNAPIKGWKIVLKSVQSPKQRLWLELSDSALSVELRDTGQYELEFISERAEKYRSTIEITDQKVIQHRLPFAFENITDNSKILTKHFGENDTLWIVYKQEVLTCGYTTIEQTYTFIRQNGKLLHKNDLHPVFEVVDEVVLEELMAIETNLNIRPNNPPRPRVVWDQPPTYTFILGNQRNTGVYYKYVEFSEFSIDSILY
jgi:hypothetical protein